MYSTYNFHRRRASAMTDDYIPWPEYSFCESKQYVLESLTNRFFLDQLVAST